MSACSNFTPGFWKKDQCCECFQKKDEHSTNSISMTAIKHSSVDVLPLFTSQRTFSSVSSDKTTSHKQQQISIDSTERPCMLKSNEQKAIDPSNFVEVTQVKATGWSCSSSFCVTYEVQSNDLIQDLTTRIEQIIPCTKVTNIMYNGRELVKDNSFTFYKITHGAILHVKTNTSGFQVQRVACMACSYHNIIYLSANIARGLNTKVNSNPEAIKASIRQWLNMMDSNDQIKIRQFLNFATDVTNIRIMVCVRDMLNEYVRINRNVEYANIIEFDYMELLNELRCPICFCRFSLYSNFSNIPVQLCTLSDKHYVCQKCFQQVNRCPLCNSALRDKAINSKHVIELLQTSMKKIEKYCFPITLNSINIKDHHQPFAHGAFCNIFQVENDAIKCPRVPASAGSDIERAIIHEIFLSRPLSHIPNILLVYGGIRLPNHGVSIVMEYVNGPSLATALDNDIVFNMTFQERLDIALGICKGLGELHLNQIVHRDFKPANVLLQRAPTASGYIPKIADFGVSFLIQTASATAVKRSGGTVGYDALEVAEGGTPSVQSDIYALSFTLYELLTVQRPFFGLKDTQIITKFTLQGERPTDWTISTADRTSLVFPECLKNTLENGWSMTPENRARIGEIISAVRKSMNSNYHNCSEKMFSSSGYSLTKDESYDFMDKFDSFELLAIQEIIKRCVIEDNEAIELLLNNSAWG